MVIVVVAMDDDAHGDTACGNQQCEFGEQCVNATCTGGSQCQADCPLPLQSCPDQCSHHGVCVASSGVCSCFSGYVGTSCASCDEGYLPINALCVFMPGALVSCSDGVYVEGLALISRRQ